jgi:hypothetical protein
MDIFLMDVCVCEFQEHIYTTQSSSFFFARPLLLPLQEKPPTNPFLLCVADAMRELI